MAERFDPDEWMRFSPQERALLRDAIRYRQVHDKCLGDDNRRALTRLSNDLSPPDPVVRDLGEE